MGRNKKKARVIGALIAVGIFLFTCTACEQKSGMPRFSTDFFGPFDTYSQVIGYTPKEKQFNEYAEFVRSELTRYHELYDIYNDYEGINNLKTVNDNAGKHPVEVEQEIIDLLSYCVDMYTLSDGKVNVAMGSVLSIWHTFREEGLEDIANAALPEMDQLRKAGEHTDIDDLVIDEKNHTVFLRDPGMRLDVGAIAKGYATQKVSEAVREKGFDSAIINVGGNVKLLGMQKGETSGEWRVGIQDPDSAMSGGSEVIQKLLLSDTCLSTSGDYQRYYIVDNVEYNHIIDPETLMPSDRFRSVTVVCDDSALSDALSTYLFLTDFEEGYEKVMEMEDVECYWIFENGDIKYTPGMEKLFTD